MKKITNLTLLIIVFFALTVFAQKKTAATAKTKAEPVDASSSTPKGEQKVTVELVSGDKLSGMFISGDTKSITIQVSSSKLTLKFDEIRRIFIGDEPASSLSNAPQTESLPSPVKETILEFEAALVFKNGEAVPVARTIFFLLDESAVTSMRQAGIRSNDGKTDDRSILFGFVLSSIRGSLEVNNSLALIKQHVKYQFQTDFTGRAVIKNVAPGKYFLFSVTEIRKANVVWNLPLEVKEGDQVKIVLDQNNAAFAI